MIPEITVLSQIATGFYVIVSTIAIFAASISARSGQMRWHVRGWILLAVLFMILALWRGLGSEEFLRETLRAWLREQGRYADRRNYQGPVVAAVLVCATLVAIRWRAISGWRPGDRRALAVAVATGAGAAMVLLVVLRLISFGPIDHVLYGPMKLNWFLDIGLGLTVAASAIHYTRLIRQRQ